jgi:DNA-binding NtrC family response regulator
MMPEMDGITFLRPHGRERDPLTTRILLTGYADKENAIRAINEAGLYYYLEKPWNNDHLKLVIRNGIERSALFNELDMPWSARWRARTRSCTACGAADAGVRSCDGRGRRRRPRRPRQRGQAGDAR